MFKIVNSIQKS